MSKLLVLVPKRFYEKWPSEKAKILSTSVRAGLSFKCISELVDKPHKLCYKKWKYVDSPDIKKGSWSVEEDSLLMALYALYEDNWAKIAKFMNGRTEVQVRKRFLFSLLESNRGRWSKEEDSRLIKGVNDEGKKWSVISREYVFTRNSRQCEHRWRLMHYKK